MFPLQFTTTTDPSLLPNMPQLYLSGGTSGSLAASKIRIIYRSGSIFDDAPAETLFVHSCNCKGVWGKAIALEFKQRYPKALETHRSYRLESDPESMIGKSMFIPPSETNVPAGHMRHHHVGCLFVKAAPGKPKDDKEKDSILKATECAMQQLLDGLAEQRRSGASYVHEIRMPKVNSGIFQVEWEDTVQILENLKIPDDVIYDSLRKIVVYMG